MPLFWPKNPARFRGLCFLYGCFVLLLLGRERRGVFGIRGGVVSGFGLSSPVFAPFPFLLLGSARVPLPLLRVCLPAGHRPPEEGRALQRVTCVLFFSFLSARAGSPLPCPFLSLSLSLSLFFLLHARG